MKFISFIVIFVAISAYAQVKPFELNQVRLTESPFKNAQDVDLKYILELNPDRLLAPYLIDAGLPIKEERYGNWESIGLDGHIGGHYLSALAMMYASTGEHVLKERLDYMLKELEKCQIANGNGYVGGIPQGKIFWERIQKGEIDGSGFGLNNTWVPFYNIHKLFAGLNDAYYYTKSKLAKSILIKLGDWFVNMIEPLSSLQIQQILRTEHGGINESFADLYILTKDEKYLQTAKKLNHKSFLEPLIQRKDELTGKHANTQIPKVLGFEKIAKLTNDKELAGASKYFWQNIALTRTVAFGGNSVAEHFNPINDFSGMVKSNQGPETCNSYNMVRLSKALYFDNNDVAYLDFYERTLYNHILSSQHPEKGGFVYFTPIRPNHYRVYSQPSTSMWCCVGSGLENHTKYGELIYSHDKDNLYVNLFIPSILNWKEKGVVLDQETKFPYENQSEITLNLKKKSKFKLYLRCPKWATDLKVFVNGELQEVTVVPSSYINIERKWKTGDKIKVEFESGLQLEQLPDGSNWVAYVKGPIVLAAKTSKEDLKGLFADDSRMGHVAHGKYIPLDEAHALVGEDSSYISRVNDLGNMKFSLDSLTLQPFFEVHDTRYQMYFQTFKHNEFKEKQALLKAQEQEAIKLNANTVDKINCGEQQPEVDHLYKGENSQSGYDDGKFWRSTRSYISYQFLNSELDGHFLEITTLNKLKTQNTKFFINQEEVKVDRINDNLGRINVEGLKIINLKIQSTQGFTSKFYQLRLIKHL